MRFTDPSRPMITRARRYAEGKTATEIAREDGVTPVRVNEHLRSLVNHAGQYANHGSELPTGLFWEGWDYEGVPHRLPTHHRGGKTTPEQVRWALLLLENKDQPEPACECCGRPL